MGRDPRLTQVLPAPGRLLNVHINVTPTGEILNRCVSEHDTFGSLREQLRRERLCPPLIAVTLSYGGLPCADEQTFHLHDVEDGATFT